LENAPYGIYANFIIFNPQINKLQNIPLIIKISYQNVGVTMSHDKTKQALYKNYNLKICDFLGNK